MAAVQSRSRTATLLVSAIVTLVAWMAPVDANADDHHTGWTRDHTRDYVMGDVGPFAGGLGCPAGTTCFGFVHGDTFSVTIEDDSGRRVGGVVRIRAYRVGTVFVRPFCGSIGPTSLPWGHLTVHLDAPGDVRGTHWYGGPGCAEIAPLGGTVGRTTLGATSGQVHLTVTKHPWRTDGHQ